MYDIAAELKSLRLHGMVGAWEEMVAQGSAGIQTSRWLIEHLLHEHTDRHALDSATRCTQRSFQCIAIWRVSTSSKSKVDKPLPIDEPATLAFTTRRTTWC